MPRPTWDEYFAAMLDVVASRSTCVRREVGAIIVSGDNQILGVGYNGVAQGLPHCNEHPHDRCDAFLAPPGADHCEAVHAECNALVRCRDLAFATTIYVTSEPCRSCVKLLLSTSIHRVAFLQGFGETYAEARDLWLRSRSGRRWDQIGRRP